MPAAEPSTTVTVTLDLERTPLDLERVLGMLRVRGYSLVRLEAASGGCTVTVHESERSPGLLEHRLRRLGGVVVVDSGSIEENAA
jgi:acetolactate synthase regulatory subunit